MSNTSLGIVVRIETITSKTPRIRVATSISIFGDSWLWRTMKIVRSASYLNVNSYCFGGIRLLKKKEAESARELGTKRFWMLLKKGGMHIKKNGKAIRDRASGLSYTVRFSSTDTLSES